MRSILMSRHARIILITLFLLVLGATDSSACPVCFGDAESNSEQGVNAAVWFLLGVTGTVLGLFSALFLRIRRRIRMIAGSDAEQTAQNA